MVNAKTARALTVRLLGRDVALECACGLTFTQPLRAAIAAECPKCGQRWRR